jgi:hypothetical protein
MVYRGALFYAQSDVSRNAFRRFYRVLAWVVYRHRDEGAR